MTATCSSGATPAVQPARARPAPPLPVPDQALTAIVRRYGTPTYAYDLDRLRSQVARLRASLPAAVELLYSLKANASLGLCGVLAGCGLGADVASAGELVTAVAAGFPPERILVSGPDKSPNMLAELRLVPQALVSVDSPSELDILAGLEHPPRVLLRLRPDFRSFASCAAGPGSRFGMVPEDYPRCRELIAAGLVRAVGFHVFAGSQVLDAAGIVHHLRGAAELALRAAQALGVTPELLDVGGGFGVPYGPEDAELDLARIGEELDGLSRRVAPARLVLELGRYLVAPAGWYLTTVIARQTHGGRPAVVVDGGTHQRGDLCGLGLRTRAYAPACLGPADTPPTPTDVLGCLSLPADVLAEAALLPPLGPGDVLAFPNAGAYGLGASPIQFHGHVAPAEVAFVGTMIEPLRPRQPVRDILRGQEPLMSIRR